MNINEIFDYLATTELDGYILTEDLREVDWEITGDELLWVSDGNTYSAELDSNDVVEIDNLVFINADASGNLMTTYVLDKANQMLTGRP